MELLSDKSLLEAYGLCMGNPGDESSNSPLLEFINKSPAVC